VDSDVMISKFQTRHRSNQDGSLSRK